MRTNQLFQDEFDASVKETEFALTLDSGEAPFRAESHLHVGEGGATTAYYQRAQLVGLSSRLRDDHNRTVLVCVDLRRVCKV